MPQKNYDISKSILKDSENPINVPFNLHTHTLIAFLILLLTIYPEPFHPSEEHHLIRNKQLENKGMVWLKKSTVQPNLSYSFMVHCSLVLGVLQNPA